MKMKKWWFICTIILFVLCDSNVQAKQIKQKAHKPTSPLAEFVSNDKIDDVYSKVVVDLKKEKVIRILEECLHMLIFHMIQMKQVLLFGPNG